MSNEYRWVERAGELRGLLLGIRAVLESNDHWNRERILEYLDDAYARHHVNEGGLPDDEH